MWVSNYRCPITKTSNWIPIIGHPRDRAPITWQIGALRANHDREFRYREVGVISRSWRLRVRTLTETLIILEITKTESNNYFIIHWTKKKGSHVFATWHDYPWPWVSLTWLLYNLQLDGRWYRKFTEHFRPIREEIVSSIYSNKQ